MDSVSHPDGVGYTLDIDRDHRNTSGAERRRDGTAYRISPIHQLDKVKRIRSIEWQSTRAFRVYEKITPSGNVRQAIQKKGDSTCHSTRDC